MPRTNNKTAKMSQAAAFKPKSNLPFWSISSKKTNSSTEHLYMHLHDGLPPVQVNYVMFDSVMYTSVSVDDETTLAQHCEAKALSLQLLDRRPIDGPSDFKLRYYIKFIPQTRKWMLSYTARPLDFDCANASTVTGMRNDFTMRYCRPLLDGAHNFFWPHGQTWSPFGIYKCQPDGTLEKVNRGDSLVVGRRFFSIGRPTVRVITQQLSTNLSLVYKLHCVDREWLKMVEEILAMDAARKKAMRRDFEKQRDTGKKRAELPVVNLNNYINRRAERGRNANPLSEDQEGKMEQQLLHARPAAQTSKQEVEKKQSKRSPSRRRPSYGSTQHTHQPSPLIRSTTIEDLSSPEGDISQEGPQQPPRMPLQRQTTIQFAQEENHRPRRASIVDFLLLKTPVPSGAISDSDDNLKPPNPPFAREAIRRKGKFLGQVGVGNGTSKDGITGTLGVVSRPTWETSGSSSFKAKATTSVTKTSVSNSSPRLERVQTTYTDDQSSSQSHRVVSAIEARLESRNIIYDNLIASDEVAPLEVNPPDAPKNVPLNRFSLALELNPETASMSHDMRSSNMNNGSMVNISSVEACYGSMSSSFPEDERQRVPDDEFHIEDTNDTSDTTLYVGSYRGPGDSTYTQSPGYVSYRTPVQVAPTGENVQRGFRGPSQSSYFGPQRQTTSAPRYESFQNGYQPGFDSYQPPHPGQPEYYLDEQMMSPKSPPDPDLIAQIEAQILAGYYNQDAASQEIQAAEEEKSYRERTGGVKN
ncbi:hypothetical protein BZA77DRAFT_373124 [Pyronema omphalodes]|nr:hypothetical protein BZA77DRAFT_373124 [Pyronema omphalodes]